MIENSSLQANSITIDESAATEQFCRSEHSSVEEILSYQVVIVGGLLESNPRLKTLLNIHFEQNTSVNYFEMSEEDALETFSQRDDDRPPETVFIIPDFETSLYGVLKKLGMRILGPPCVVDLLTRDFKLDSPRIGDMFACSLLRAIIVFSGFERGQRSELSRLTKIAHFLGARVKQEVNGSVTHLISPTVRSTLYDDAVGLGVATLSPDWLRHCWERRHDTTFVGTDQIITRDFFILPFSGLQIAFHGFSTSDLREIEPLVVDNGFYLFNIGGLLVSINSSMLTHIVVHHTGSSDFLSPTKEGVWVVSSKWFYDSIQFQIKKPEAAHSIGFDRKKKKLEDFSSPFAMSSPRTQKKASPLQNMKKRLSRGLQFCQ